MDTRGKIVEVKIDGLLSDVSPASQLPESGCLVDPPIWKIKLLMSNCLR